MSRIMRKDYLDKKATHDEYYSQFVSNYTKTIVKNNIGMDKILESKDRYLNDIPLRKWDNLADGLRYYMKNEREEVGEFYSISWAVCVLKASAKELINDYKNN